MISRDTLLLLDTNILVHLLRDKAAGRWIEDRFELRSREETPLISHVTLGELLALAKQWRWGPEKQRKISFLPRSYVTLDLANWSVLERYAALSVRWRREGKRMEQNDLWIAATAAIAGAVVLTSDGDFLKLAPEVGVEWVDPEELKKLG